MILLIPLMHVQYKSGTIQKKEKKKLSKTIKCVAKDYCVKFTYSKCVNFCVCIYAYTMRCV